MADLSKITLPNNTTVNLKDAYKSGVYTVIGTQTAATGTWTGALHGVRALYDGLTIMYYLPWNGSGNATLNLTLDDGTTTGAINCYYSTSRLTTHYGKGCNIVMTYYSAGSIKVDGTATTDNRWIANANYTDGNDTSTVRPYYSRPTTGGNGVKQYSIFARILNNTYSSFTTNNGTGDKTFDSTNYFDPTKIFYYNGSGNVASGSVLGYNTVTLSVNLFDVRYNFNGVTTTASTSSIAADKPLFLVFDRESENEGCFRLKSPYYTQAPSDKKALYTLIGYVYDSYRCDLWVDNPVFTYDGTNLIPYSKSGGERIRWQAVTQGQKWSRVYQALPMHTVVGSSGIFSAACTRGNVVCSATFLVSSSHAGSNFANCIELASGNYSEFRVRLVSNNQGEYYFEIYDNIASIASGTTQSWDCSFTPIIATQLVPFRVFTDGSTVPSGYTAMNDFTITKGSTAAAIKNISRSGTTFTATRQDGSTFTFTQQDNNTTYTLGTSGNNVTLTPAGGTAQSITAPYATNAGTATKADTIATEVGSSAGARPIFYAWLGDNSKVVYNTAFTYNPSGGVVTATKFVGALQGNADTATKATQDESGNNIKATYANSFSISDHTITLKNKNGASLGTVTVPDNNTTYTFANGTNGFTVTPNGGTAQTVTVTPSITNNVTGSGTSGYIAKWNGANTITNGPAFGSATTTYLRNDGTWATPANTDTKVTQTVLSSTASAWRKVVLSNSYSSSAGASASDVTDIEYVSNLLEYQNSSGTLQATVLNATSNINANTAGSSTAGGISLYSTNQQDTYGIIFRGTASKGKHGYVQGDWATYFTMNNSANRGWVFNTNGVGNVASVSNAGHAVFNGSVTIGGNTTNTSGARMEYNTTTQAIDFVFN